jgi:aryl-alcohol dehydrogenase-like predicted oxidoreductase
MKKRSLGTQGLEVTSLGYGAMGSTSFYGPSDVQEGIRTIQRAHELGVDFFDTAELYGWGENEKLVGKAVRGFRLHARFQYGQPSRAHSRSGG